MFEIWTMMGRLRKENFLTSQSYKELDIHRESTKGIKSTGTVILKWVIRGAPPIWRQLNKTKKR